MIRGVVLDIGETILDESRHWASWADWLGVTRFTFSAILGSVLERGEHHRRVFEEIRPGLDVERERERRRQAGFEERIEKEDLYPDAIPCLAALRRAGYRVGVVGNQPAWAEADLRRLELPADWIASSAGWGVEKPARGFFDRVCQVAGLPAREIAYVGDRLDNDVLPARDAGMVAVFLRRGPWGFIHATRPEAAQAHVRIDSLEELAPALAARDSAAEEEA